MFDWQFLIVVASLLASAAYVAYRLWQTLTARRSCGSCATCPSKQDSDELPIVSLDLQLSPQDQRHG